jgi:hypothetical protein
MIQDRRRWGFELRGRDWCSWNSWARGLSGHTWPAYHGQCCGQARSSGCTARGRRSCRSLAARQAIVRREGRVDLGSQQDGGMTIAATSATSGWSRDDRRFPSSRLRSILVHKRPGMDEETSLTLFLLQKELKAFSPFEPGAAKIRMANIYSQAFGQGSTPTMLTSSSTKSYLFSSVLDPYRFFLVSPLCSSLPSLGTDWWSLYLPLGENPQSPDILSPVPLKIVTFEASPSRGARPAWDLRIFTEPASSRNLLLSLLTPGGSNT